MQALVVEHEDECITTTTTTNTAMTTATPDALTTTAADGTSGIAATTTTTTTTSSNTMDVVLPSGGGSVIIASQEAPSMASILSGRPPATTALAKLSLRNLQRAASAGKASVSVVDRRVTIVLDLEDGCCVGGGAPAPGRGERAMLQTSAPSSLLAYLASASEASEASAEHASSDCQESSSCCADSLKDDDDSEEYHSSSSSSSSEAAAAHGTGIPPPPPRPDPSAPVMVVMARASSHPASPAPVRASLSCHTCMDDIGPDHWDHTAFVDELRERAPDAAASFVPHRCAQSVCRPCLQEYWSVSLRNVGAFGAGNVGFQGSCLYCGMGLTTLQLEELVGSDFTRQAENQSTLAYLRTEPAVLWCTSPGCGNAVFAAKCRRNTRTTFYECDDCKASDTCAYCKGPAHASKRDWCQARRDRMQGDRAYRRYVGVRTKKCPRCKTPIQKNGGCSHMSCSNCSYYFCWRCGRDLNHHVVCGPFLVAAILTSPVWIPLGVAAAVTVGPILLVRHVWRSRRYRRNQRRRARQQHRMQRRSRKSSA